MREQAYAVLGEGGNWELWGGESGVGVRLSAGADGTVPEGAPRSGEVESTPADSLGFLLASD